MRTPPPTVRPRPSARATPTPSRGPTATPEIPVSLLRPALETEANDPSMNVLERLRAAFAAATPEGADASAFAAAVRPSTDPKFGDYQANGCMAVAKAAKKNPRELAQAVASSVDLAPMAGTPEVAGPGFLNVRLHDDWISGALGELLVDEALGLRRPNRPRRS